MIGTFREICTIPRNAGLLFDQASVRGVQIRKSAGYGGVRIELLARLDGARISLQVDLDFGDAVTPGPEAVRYPVLLYCLPAPELRAYPKATVVAEKLHAICLLGLARPLRPRSAVARRHDRSGRAAARDRGDLRAARVALPDDWPLGLSDAFAGDTVKQAQWTGFLKKNRLDLVGLPELIERLRASLARLDPSPHT